MLTRHAFSRLGAVMVVAGALSLVVPSTAFAGPFVPGAISTCAPGEIVTFNADRVAPDKVRYSTTAPLSKWNGTVVQWTNLTSGFQGVALINDPVPATVGFGPVMSMAAGLLPCFVSSSVTMS